MAELKTQKNKRSVEKFLNAIESEKRRRDCFTLLEWMRTITGSEPAMWGESIVGFGGYHYTYASGREGDWFLTGFSPRKQNLTLYIMPGVEAHGELLKKLGKYKTSKSCLYVNNLDDVDADVLKKMITDSIRYLRENYETV